MKGMDNDGGGDVLKGDVGGLGWVLGRGFA